MATARERFSQTLNLEPADPPVVFWSGAWQTTLDLWREQGWDGRPFDQIFDVDRLLPVEVKYGPVPEFAYEVLEETDRTRLYVNHEGILMWEFKEHSETSMPQFVKFPVENGEDFERLASERLGLNPEERFPEEWKRRVKEYKDSDQPRRCWPNRWGGFFGTPRNLMGGQNLCLAFYDQPELVERIMTQRADAMIAITEEIMKYTDFEVFWFWEDMAYNHGPLIGPELYRRFALPHYRRVCDWLHERGIEHIWLDSDGDIHKLIPIWLDAGINGLWPFEVQAGMDVVEIRRTYGRDLRLAGGIDKRAVAKGGDAMRQAVDCVMPLVEDGGYFPELDHSAPPDISWSNMCEYASYLLHRLGRG